MVIRLQRSFTKSAPVKLITNNYYFRVFGDGSNSSSVGRLVDLQSNKLDKECLKTLTATILPVCKLHELDCAHEYILRAS